MVDESPCIIYLITLQQLHLSFRSRVQCSEGIHKRLINWWAPADCLNRRVANRLWRRLAQV